MNRTLLLLVKLVLSVGLLVYLLQSVDLSDVLRHFIEGQHGLFAVAAVVYIVVVLLSTVRWKVLLDAIEGGPTFGELLKSYMVASFFGNFLPSNVGGDVVRVRDTAKHAGSHTAALTVAFVDRVVGFVALYFIAAPAFLVGGSLVRGLAGARVILLGLTALFIVLGAIFMRSGFVTRDRRDRGRPALPVDSHQVRIGPGDRERVPREEERARRGLPSLSPAPVPRRRLLLPGGPGPQDPAQPRARPC